MTTTTYPVDSTTRTCCGGIGTHTRECPDAPMAPPAAAKAVWDWQLDTRRGGVPTVRRGFNGSSWEITRDYDGATLSLGVSGWQYADGRTEREVILMDMPDGPLTPAEARQLADAIRAAADEADA